MEHGDKEGDIANAHHHRSLIDSLNGVLDRWPRTELRLGYRPVPMFLVAAIIGLAVGSLLLVALTALSGADVLVAIGLVPIAATASVLLSIVRKRRAGIEHWVLLEHLAVGLAAAGGALALAGEPLIPWLDRMFAGFSVIFCFGRLGCASAGCCYGHRSSLGIDPGPSHVDPGRRFPVQLVEAGCWAVCAALAVLLIAVAAPGLAFGTSALLYGVARFFLEGLRGDERPRFLRLSESRWLAMGLAAAAVLVLHRSDHISTAGLYLGGAGLFATTILWLTSRAWLRLQPELDAAARVELADFGRGLAVRGPDNAVHRTELATASVVASWMNTGRGFELYVSVSARSPAVMGPAEAELMLETVSEGLGIRGETPSVVETGAGHYVTRIARDEVHFIEVDARSTGGATESDNLRHYFAPHSEPETAATPDPSTPRRGSTAG